MLFDMTVTQNDSDGPLASTFPPSPLAPGWGSLAQLVVYFFL